MFSCVSQRVEGNYAMIVSQYVLYQPCGPSLLSLCPNRRVSHCSVPRNPVQLCAVYVASARHIDCTSDFETLHVSAPQLHSGGNQSSWWAWKCLYQ